MFSSHAVPTHRRTPSTPTPRRARPRLEALEDRLALNNRFVVPAGADNVTTFTTLQAALTTPGLVAGNAIQIEPGAAPGNVTGANLIAPNVANLTIQGDPAATLANIPQFTVDHQTTF